MHSPFQPRDWRLDRPTSVRSGSYVYRWSPGKAYRQHDCEWVNAIFVLYKFGGFASPCDMPGGGGRPHPPNPGRPSNRLQEPGRVATPQGAARQLLPGPAPMLILARASMTMTSVARSSSLGYPSRAVSRLFVIWINVFNRCGLGCAPASRTASRRTPEHTARKTCQDGRNRNPLPPGSLLSLEALGATCAAHNPIGG
jgi:hypothetical protein